MASIVTTNDNPFDPRTDFGPWYAWDVAKGYNTCAYLARILSDADDFPDQYNDRIVEAAIDEMVELHNGEVYKKLPALAA